MPNTLIPGCDGKGIVDLLLIYGPDRLAAAWDTLDGLGFQRQIGLDPFPEERLLRLDAIVHDGELFRLHVHVVAEAADEVAELIDSRDRLRAELALVKEYVESKRVALGGESTNNIDYYLAMICGSRVMICSCTPLGRVSNCVGHADGQPEIRFQHHSS